MQPHTENHLKRNGSRRILRVYPKIDYTRTQLCWKKENIRKERNSEFKGKEEHTYGHSVSYRKKTHHTVLRESMEKSYSQQCNAQNVSLDNQSS